MKKIILTICLFLTSASVFAYNGYQQNRNSTSTTVPGGHGQSYTFHSDGTTSQTFSDNRGGSFTVNSDGSTSEQLPYYGGYNGYSENNY